MFPGVYGFTWDAGNLIFLGLFFTVAIVLATTVTLAALRTFRDLRLGQEESIRWHEDFQALPAPLRACRHELTGEVTHRRCQNGFDCRSCAFHREFAAATPGKADAVRYHRGHTCVRQEEDGTYQVSLTEFGRKLLGTPDAVMLPAPGTRLRVNGKGWTVRRQGKEVRVLSPVDGTVLEQGGDDRPWSLRVAPSAGAADPTHLLGEREAEAWRVRELERLEILLGGAAAPALADGGELMDNLPAHYPEADWDDVWGQMFLES
jgi:hypothetical protein